MITYFEQRLLKRRVLTIAICISLWGYANFTSASDINSPQSESMIGNEFAEKEKVQAEVAAIKLAEKNRLAARKRILSTGKPEEIYLAGVKAETSSDYDSAKILYDHVITKFPKKTVALKAADRLLAIKDKFDTQTSKGGSKCTQPNDIVTPSSTIGISAPKAESAKVVVVNAVTDCRVNSPDISGLYSGECVAGVANGKGIAKGRDTYEGELKNGNIHGQGTYRWGDGANWAGDYFVGEFIDGDRVKGVYTRKNGTIIEGTFRDGLLHGIGVTSYPIKSNSFWLSWTESELKSIGMKLIGDYVVAKGLYSNGEFIYGNCTDIEDCKIYGVDLRRLHEQATQNRGNMQDIYPQTDNNNGSNIRLCEAQRKSCLAACNKKDKNCNRTCSSISCY